MFQIRFFANLIARNDNDLQQNKPTTATRKPGGAAGDAIFFQKI